MEAFGGRRSFLESSAFAGTKRSESEPKPNRSELSGRRHVAISSGTSRAQCADWNGFLAWRVFVFFFLRLEPVRNQKRRRRHVKRTRSATSRSDGSAWQGNRDVPDTSLTQSGYSRDTSLSRLRLYHLLQREAPGGRALWRWLYCCDSSASKSPNDGLKTGTPPKIRKKSG